MAKNDGKPKKFVFKGYVNVYFTEDQKSAAISWMKGFGEEPIDALAVLVEAMWKVSFSWDTYHGVYQVALVCHDTYSSYFGRCFTFKHGDPARALLILRFFYDSQLKDGLYRLDEPTGDHDW